MRQILLSGKKFNPLGVLAAYDFTQGADTDILYDKIGGYNLQLGSEVGADTNDPAWIPQGLSFGGDDFTLPENINKDIVGLQLAFYLPNTVSASTTPRQILCGFALAGVMPCYLCLGASTSLLANEIITYAHENTTYRAGWCSASDTILGGWHIVELLWTDNAHRIILDGLEKTVTVNGSPVNPTANKFSFGTAHNGTTFTYPFTGYVGYSVVYAVVPTDAQLKNNRDYIKQKLRKRGVSI